MTTPPRDPAGHHGHDHDHHHHDHSHGHDHDHEASELSETALRVRALESILIEKGYIDPAVLDQIIDRYETKVGPRNGAQVVARSWADPDFRAWLLKDATAAIHSMGFTGYQGEHMIAVENTPQQHNLIACTLCSCYPWPVLGLPPAWFKSFGYRSRAVIDPRGTLAELGFVVPDTIAIRVWDSTAETRYMVVPMRPAGTDGWTVEQLTELVSRDSMIGAAYARDPASLAAPGAKP